jgi:hypothetical protein
VGTIFRGMGIQSVGNGVVAEELEKMRELNNPGKQIEEKADSVMELLDKQGRTNLFLDKISVRWWEVRIELEIFGVLGIPGILRYI